MMKINNKELSSLSLKELKFYLELLQDKIDELTAEDDIKHGRVYTHEQVTEYFKIKCQKK